MQHWKLSDEEYDLLNDPDTALSWKAKIAYTMEVRRVMNYQTGIAYISHVNLARSCEVRPKKGRHTHEEVRPTQKMGRKIRAELIKSGLCQEAKEHPKFGPGLYCPHASVSTMRGIGGAYEGHPNEGQPETPFQQGLGIDEGHRRGTHKTDDEGHHSGGSGSSDIEKKKTKQKKKTEKLTVAEVAQWSDEHLPEFIERDGWDAFMEVRKQNRAVQSPYALGCLLSKLERFNADGYDVNALIERAAVNGWKDVYEPKTPPPQQTASFAGAL